MLRRDAGHLFRHGKELAPTQATKAPAQPGDEPLQDGAMQDGAPLAVDEALQALDRCTDRDDALRIVLRAAALWLRDVQIYVVRGSFLRGQLAMRPGRLEPQLIGGRALDIGASEAVFRVLHHGRGALVTVGESDPIGYLTHHRRLVMQPVQLGERPVCLVLGSPGTLEPAAARQRLVDLARIADGAAVVFLRLILRSRKADAPGAAQPERSVSERVTPPATTHAQHPPQHRSRRRADPAAAQPQRPAQHRSDRVASPVDAQAQYLPQPRPWCGARAPVCEAQVIPLTRPRRVNGSSKAHRFPRTVEINASSRDNFYTGLDGSIHRGGIFVSTRTPHRVGETVEVTFTLPELLGSQTVSGPVVWVQQCDEGAYDGLGPGMGIRIATANLSAGVRTAIERFLKRHPPLLFE